MKRLRATTGNTIQFQSKMRTNCSKALEFAHECECDLDNSMVLSGNETLFEQWAKWAQTHESEADVYALFNVLITTQAKPPRKTIFEQLDVNLKFYKYTNCVVYCLLSQPTIFEMVSLHECSGFSSIIHSYELGHQKFSGYKSNLPIALLEQRLLMLSPSQMYRVLNESHCATAADRDAPAHPRLPLFCAIASNDEKLVSCLLSCLPILELDIFVTFYQSWKECYWINANAFAKEAKSSDVVCNLLQEARRFQKMHYTAVEAELLKILPDDLVNLISCFWHFE
jgi:hypothetical protein